jgi:hypothetical protein
MQQGYGGSDNQIVNAAALDPRSMFDQGMIRAREPDEERAGPGAVARGIWWIDPTRCLLFLILPIYAVSGFLGGEMMSEFGSANFLTTRTLLIGSACIIMMALGCLAGQNFAHRVQPRRMEFDPRRFDQALVALSMVAIVAHMLLLGNVLANPAAMIAALRGQAGAIFDVKEQVLKLVGITSLVNVTPLALVMASHRRIVRGASMPLRFRWLFWALCCCVLMRGFIAMERLAIVEAAIAYCLPLFSYGPRRFKLVGFFPLFGIAGVFTLFSIGEYTRSWPYYIDRYDNFLQFASLRLLGYISVASNTAAGVFDKFDPVGHPYLTATWFERLGFVSSDDVGVMDRFFAAYGNAEYNNPGGVMAAVIDFGMVGGMIYYLAAGAIIGWFYGRYRQCQPIGLLGYPLFFVGLAILTQLIYWGDPRFITGLAALAVTLTYMCQPSGRRVIRRLNAPLFRRG